MASAAAKSQPQVTACPSQTVAIPHQAQVEMIRDQDAQPPAIPDPTHMTRIGLHHNDNCKRDVVVKGLGVAMGTG